MRKCGRYEFIELQNKQILVVLLQHYVIQRRKAQIGIPTRQHTPFRNDRTKTEIRRVQQHKCWIMPRIHIRGFTLSLNTASYYLSKISKFYDGKLESRSTFGSTSMRKCWDEKKENSEQERNQIQVQQTLYGI